MPRFGHFILTRFNVRVAYARTRSGLDPLWLAHRFQLFDEFCYPSVRAQSNQNFKWLVFFDSETPEPFRKQVEEYGKWETFLPRYVQGPFTEDTAREAILQASDAPLQYLITTRLDNDDAVHRDFVAMIQQEFRDQELEFLNLTYGYELCNHRLHWRPDAQNAFLSLVQKVEASGMREVRTVLGGVSHEQARRVAPVRQVGKRAAWLQVIHGQNVRNEVRGIRQPLAKLRDGFSVHPKHLSSDETWVGCRIAQVADVARVLPKFFNPRKLAKFVATLR